MWRKITGRIIGILLVAVLGFAGGFYTGRGRVGWGLVGGLGGDVGGRAGVDLSLFWTVWEKLDRLYYDQKALDVQKMTYGAISGMVAALGDPYTVFLTPKDNGYSKDDLGGSFGGVGIQLGFTDGKLSVSTPLPGSPAMRAGVKSGDLILTIKDSRQNVNRDTSGMSLSEAVDLIRGPKGTTVSLRLKREEREFWVDLRRDEIVVKSVELTWREVPGGGKVAVLRLNKFGGRTEQEWTEAVNLIKQQERGGAKVSVVLDLRNNPGGYLDGAVWIASEFLGSGTVVSQQNRPEVGTKSFDVNRKGRMLTEPMVVLINGGSASAAEIVAGALRDHGRATLVGEKTFGKGTVQQPEELPGGAGLHVTVARWLLPSGKWIDKVGVEPEIVVTNDEDVAVDEQLEKAVEIILSKS